MEREREAEVVAKEKEMGGEGTEREAEAARKETVRYSSMLTKGNDPIADLGYIISRLTEITTGKCIKCTSIQIVLDLMQQRNELRVVVSNDEVLYN